jgi:hypothetical protein
MKTSFIALVLITYSVVLFGQSPAKEKKEKSSKPANSALAELAKIRQQVEKTEYELNKAQNELNALRAYLEFTDDVLRLYKILCPSTSIDTARMLKYRQEILRLKEKQEYLTDSTWIDF